MIKTLGKILNVSKSCHAMLRQIYITGCQAMLTNITTSVVIREIPCAEIKTLDFEDFAKTKDFAGCDTGFSSEPPELPAPTEDDGEPVDIDPSVFAETLTPYIKHMSEDYTCGVLCGVYLGPEYTCATDGHTLKIDHARKCSAGVILSRELVDIIEALRKSGEIVFSAVKTGKHIRLDTRTVTVYSRGLIEGLYPDATRVILEAKDQQGVLLTVEELNTPKVALKTLLPYTNARTHLLEMYGSKLFTGNVYIELPFTINPQPHGIGINADYFLDILCDMTLTTDIRMNTPISAIVLRPEGTQEEHLIMPLRVVEDGYTEGKNYRKIEVPSVPQPKLVLSGYHLFKCDTMYGITTNATMPGIVRELTTKEYNTLRTIGVKELTA